MLTPKLIQVHNRTQLLLNLERSGMLTMTPKVREEANLVCFYLARRVQGNHITAKNDLYTKHGITEKQIKELVKKFKASAET